MPGINLETDIVFASDLVDLQRLLSRWKLGLAELWINEAKRQEMAALAQQWCDRIQSQGGVEGELRAIALALASAL